MEVRAGDSAGRAREAEALAARDALAGLHVDPREVHVHRQEAVAVVDEDVLPGEEVVGREDDEPALRREDGRPDLRTVVDASVRGAGLAVEEAPCPEVARGRLGERRRQREGERRVRPEGRRGDDLAALALDAAPDLLRDADGPRVDPEALRRVGRREDADRRGLLFPARSRKTGKSTSPRSRSTG